MTYLSGFTSDHSNLKRIHSDSRKTKPCRVENDAKTLNSRFLSPVSMGLILVFIYTIILIKNSSQKSKTRVLYLTFHNNDFASLQDHFKVIRSSKNNFRDSFSITQNGIFQHFTVSPVNKPF